MSKDYLFVYGTLRRGYGLLLMQEVAGKMVYTGEGLVKAALYDLGSYPAAVASSLQQELKGDIYELLDAEKVFALLDDYEGDEYKQKKVEVNIANDTKIHAWIYWYTGSVEEWQRIEESDYLDYLKNKKERFI